MATSAANIIKRILLAHPKEIISDTSLEPAGVMLLIYEKKGEYCILLNKRTDLVDQHKGEISFPGGRMSPEDTTLMETAFRETYEEMGILPKDVTILGELDDVPTNSRYLINTFVGTIPYPYPFKPSKLEVAEILEIPVTAFMKSDYNHKSNQVVKKSPTKFPSYSYKEHVVFGATARILNRFVSLLEADRNEEAPWKKNLT